ncbi:11746_t:CDS:2, partial [Gigaspora rosea]
YQQAFEILFQARQNGVSETDLAVHLHFNAATDQHHYNLPTTNKIAIILLGDDFQIVFDKFGQHAEDQSNAPQFLVNTWASTEQNQLRYLHTNQATLRADVYQRLADTIGTIANEEINLANLEQRIILPSSHLGSSHYMFENFQDSIAIT